MCVRVCVRGCDCVCVRARACVRVWCAPVLIGFASSALIAVNKFSLCQKKEGFRGFTGVTADTTRITHSHTCIRMHAYTLLRAHMLTNE